MTEIAVVIGIAVGTFVLFLVLRVMILAVTMLLLTRKDFPKPKVRRRRKTPPV